MCSEVAAALYEKPTCFSKTIQLSEKKGNEGISGRGNAGSQLREK